MFHDVLFKSNLPAPEKTIERLGGEATLVVIGGSDTTGNSLTKLHYYLLANPDKLVQLKEELRDFFSNQGDEIPKWQELKNLSYLSACIQEILRLGSAVTHRLARVAPKGGLKYGEYLLPPGVCPLNSSLVCGIFAGLTEMQTSVSMSAYFTHMDPELFPSPHDFVPERWLSPEGKAKTKYVNAFSKGPRICLGME